MEAFLGPGGDDEVCDVCWSINCFYAGFLLPKGAWKFFSLIEGIKFYAIFASLKMFCGNFISASINMDGKISAVK